jgi:hypothetical protein
MGLTTSTYAALSKGRKYFQRANVLHSVKATLNAD